MYSRTFYIHFINFFCVSSNLYYLKVERHLEYCTEYCVWDLYVRKCISVMNVRYVHYVHRISSENTLHTFPLLMHMVTYYAIC